LGSEKPRRGGTQSRCAAGDEKDVIADLHGKLAYCSVSGREFTRAVDAMKRSRALAPA
jgi:hypothetical protein